MIYSPTDSNILQDDLTQLEKWEKARHVKFNIKKCMVLTITLKKKPVFTEYYLDNQNLDTVSKAKYLGVILDSKLSFNDHVDAICKKLILY